jgi:hypothetical protein
MAEGGFQVREKSLQDSPMSDAAYVDQAADWAKALTRNEARGPGDLENAMHRLEARYGVPWRTFWALRYRKPEWITAFTYQRLRDAYQAECERQMRLYQHELEITKAKAGADQALVSAAAALAGEDHTET